MEDRIIPASELIINDDGSAFHIHVRPDQLRDNIIFVGDPGRVDLVASMFDSIDFEVSSREFHTIGGSYKGKPVMAISHGIGPDNIEIVVTELDALANIDFAACAPNIAPSISCVSVLQAPSRRISTSVIMSSPRRVLA